MAGDWVGDHGHLADAVLASARTAARAAYLLTVLGWRDGRVAETLSIVNPHKLRHFHESRTGA